MTRHKASNPNVVGLVILGVVLGGVFWVLIVPFFLGLFQGMTSRMLP